MLIMLREVGESFHKSHFRDQHQKLYLGTQFQSPTPTNKNSLN